MSSVDAHGLLGMPQRCRGPMVACRAARVDRRPRETSTTSSGRARRCVTDGRVHDVVAHLIDVASTTRLGFAIDMARARFDFDRQNANGLDELAAPTPTRRSSGSRQVATRRAAPPAPLDTRIVEDVVHGEDIRRRHRPAPRLSGRGRSSGAAPADPHAWRVVRRCQANSSARVRLTAHRSSTCRSASESRERQRSERHQRWTLGRQPDAAYRTSRRKLDGTRGSGRDDCSPRSWHATTSDQRGTHGR